MSDHDRHAESVGAYLLGALPPLESQAFESHLAGCAACRDEVETLATVVDALPRSVEQLEPPPSLRQALLREVEAEARVRAVTAAPRRTARRLRPDWGAGRWLSGLRPALAGAAAAAVLLVGGLGGYLLADGPTERVRTLSATVDRERLPQASGSLMIPPDAPGAMPVLRVHGVPPPRPGRVLQVWLRRGGEIQPATVFTVAADGSGEAVVSQSLDGVEAVMVTREKRGGARAPTEVPVLTVRLN